MTIQTTDRRAVQIRSWLNERHTAYLARPLTDAQLGVWLDEAEASEGLIEIRAHESVSGAPETFRVALCAIEENDATRWDAVTSASEV